MSESTQLGAPTGIRLRQAEMCAQFQAQKKTGHSATAIQADPPFASFCKALPPRLEGEPTPHRARVRLLSHIEGMCAGAFGVMWADTEDWHCPCQPRRRLKALIQWFSSPTVHHNPRRNFIKM